MARIGVDRRKNIVNLTHIRPPKSRDKGIPNKLFIADQPVSIVHLFPRSDLGSKILVQ